MKVGIIGGGIIGCAIAWALARRGVRVTLVEPRRIGAGATHASAGALVPYVEAHDSGALLALSTRSLALYDAFIRDVREDSGLDVDYARCGSLEIAVDATEEGRLRRTVVEHADAGLRWATHGELAALMPGISADAIGGVVARDHGYVSAPQLAIALFAGAQAKATTMIVDRVTGVMCAESGATIVCANSPRQTFDHVVIASGAWASTLSMAETATSIPVRPVKGQLLRVRPPAPLPRLLWSSAAYFVPQGNGDVLVGATMEDAGFDETTTEDAASQLLASAVRMFPGWVDCEVIEARAGLRPATPDSLPLVGRARDCPAVTYAVGHFRNGIILAPLTAELVAASLVDGFDDPALDVLAPARFGA